MSPLFRFGLLLALTSGLSACASDDPEGRKKDDEKAKARPETKRRRASEQIDDYDGKPKVIPIGPAAASPSSVQGPSRTLVYITKESTKYLKLKRSERVKRKDKVLRSFVLTDTAAITFRKNYKKTHPSIPSGSVTSLRPDQVADLLAKLDQLGFNRLPFINGAPGDPIPKKRAIHVDIGGQRRSVYRDQVRPDGTKNSSKSIYFRCEVFLVNYFQTIQLGRD